MRGFTLVLTLAVLGGCAGQRERPLAQAPALAEAPATADAPTAAFIHEPGELARMTAQAEKFCSMYGGIAELQRDVPLDGGDLMAEFVCR